MKFFLFGKTVETQKLSFFSLGLLPVFSTVSSVALSFFITFHGSNPPRVQVVCCMEKVCGFSQLVIMAASV